MNVLNNLITINAFASTTGNANTDKLINDMFAGGEGSKVKNMLSPFASAANFIFWAFMTVLAVWSIYRLTLSIVAYHKADKTDHRQIQEYKDAIRNWCLALAAVVVAPSLLALLMAFNIL